MYDSLCPSPIPASFGSGSPVREVVRAGFPTSTFVSSLLCLLCLLGFPGGSAAKESACNVGDLGLIPGLGRSHGGGNGYPLQYSGLENSMDCSPWGGKETDTTERLSVEHFTVLGGLLHCEPVIAVKCQTNSKSNM